MFASSVVAEVKESFYDSDDSGVEFSDSEEDSDDGSYNPESDQVSDSDGDTYNSDTAWTSEDDEEDLSAEDNWKNDVKKEMGQF